MTDSESYSAIVQDQMFKLTFNAVHDIVYRPQNNWIRLKEKLLDKKENEAPDLRPSEMSGL